MMKGGEVSFSEVFLGSFSRITTENKVLHYFTTTSGSELFYFWEETIQRQCSDLKDAPVLYQSRTADWLMC